MTHPSASSRPVNGVWKTALTDNSSTAQEPLGMKRCEYDDTYGTQEYSYVRNNSAVDITDGMVVCDTGDYKMRVAAAATNKNKAAGVAFGTITASYCGWLQTKGYHDYVLTDGAGDIADNDWFVANGAGKANRSAAGSAATYTPVGVAVANDDTTSVEAYLCLG